MSNYFVAPAGGRRDSADVANYRAYEYGNRYTEQPRRSSRYAEPEPYTYEGNRRRGALVTTQPRYASYGEEGSDRGQTTYSRPRPRKRTTSRPHFRDDASVIDDDEPMIPDRQESLLRSQARPSQRPTLLRTRSHRQGLDDDGEHDLERKNTQTNRQFRDRRANYENAEAAALVRAKGHEREAYGYPRRERYGSPVAYESPRPRYPRPKTQVLSNDRSSGVGGSQVTSNRGDYADERRRESRYSRGYDGDRNASYASQYGDYPRHKSRSDRKGKGLLDRFQDLRT